MSAPVTFLDGRVTLYLGDCREVIAGLPDASVDSVVTDPPYELKFMSKGWDGSGIAFRPDLWASVLRVLKPGGHMVAFSGTRTYHRMVCAIEDAGFEIRDQIGWVFGSGFPKSHDVSKGIDRAAGAEREKIATGAPVKRMIPGADQNKVGWEKNNGREYLPGVEIPATDEANHWQGWGTALKPAWEPICLARKPLIGTVVENVLKHGTGALNINACRVATDDNPSIARRDGKPPTREAGSWANDRRSADTFAAPRPGESLGRWPANIVHDGSEEVLAAFPETAAAAGGRDPKPHNGNVHSDAKGYHSPGRVFFDDGSTRHGDSGSAARFFYTAKADSTDRIGSKHPTVKPVDLMRWLCRLITPPGGTILDPFAGTGTTAEAAFYEGFSAILIEREAEYVADIERRMRLVMAGPDERVRESIKARMNGKPRDDGPLFAEVTA